MVDELVAAGVERDGLLEPREAEHVAARVVRLDDAVGGAAAATRRVRARPRSPRRPCRSSGRAACRGREARRSPPPSSRRAGRGRRWRTGSCPVGGSRTPYRQVTNIFSGMSGHRCSLTRSSTSPGSMIRCADARSTLRVAAITSAAGTPLSVTSPMTKPMRPSLERDHVVEVAADLASGPVVRRDLPVGEVGQLLGQEVLLDEPGDLELLLEALPGRRLGLLLADQLADPQRRRGLGGEVVEQLAVVGGVLLLGAARTEVEDADQLALADQGHRELDAGLLHRREGRRAHLEALDVDGAASALQVGEQRVVRARCRSGATSWSGASSRSSAPSPDGARSAERPRKRRRKAPVNVVMVRPF